MSHHTADPTCPLCDEKLTTAHPYLQSWFRELKKSEPLAHISWAYRGEADQEQFFSEGKTRAHFPKSPHNHEENGKPCSLALDLFEITEDRLARFSPMFYARVNAQNERQGLPIMWGGKFKSLGDGDHYQIEGQPSPMGAA